MAIKPGDTVYVLEDTLDFRPYMIKATITEVTTYPAYSGRRARAYRAVLADGSPTYFHHRGHLFGKERTVVFKSPQRMLGRDGVVKPIPVFETRQGVTDYCYEPDPPIPMPTVQQV